MQNKVLTFLGLVVLAGLAYWFWAGPMASSQHSQNATAAGDTVKAQRAKPASNEAQQEVRPDGKTPKIYFPEVSHDFGTVTQDATVTYKFEVQNKGDAPLKLIRAKGS